jgi:hypothetical protein
MPSHWTALAWLRIARVAKPATESLATAERVRGPLHGHDGRLAVPAKSACTYGIRDLWIEYSMLDRSQILVVDLTSNRPWYRRDREIENLAAESKTIVCSALNEHLYAQRALWGGALTYSTLGNGLLMFRGGATG